MLRPFLAMLEGLGIDVERGDYAIEHVQDPTRVHLLWGMSHRPPVYQELAKLPNVYFLENGWFTQRTGFYIDKLGPNGLSSIRAELTTPESIAIDVSQVETRIKKLHTSLNIKPLARQGEDYFFVPLQVERDTQLLYWSNAPIGYPHRQEWLIEQICRQFPGRRIVIRPHPRDQAAANRVQQKLTGKPYARGVEFRSEDTSYDWLASAKYVIGFNSTVLLEALTFFKPVAAMGTGLFESNGVMLECKGNPSKLAQLPSYSPDPKQIARFLALLWQRQIPYDIKPQEIGQYPVLREMLAWQTTTFES